MVKLDWHVEPGCAMRAGQGNSLAKGRGDDECGEGLHRIHISA